MAEAERARRRRKRKGGESRGNYSGGFLASMEFGEGEEQYATEECAFF